jgi:hypothetical protein
VAVFSVGVVEVLIVVGLVVEVVVGARGGLLARCEFR